MVQSAKSTDLKFGPPRDRRSGRRIFTVKNVGLTLAALAVLFLFVSYLSEFRHTKPGEYGGLYSRRNKESVNVPAPHYEVVKEGQVSESSSADPMLIETARKEQMLGVTPTQTAAPVLTPSSSPTELQVSQAPRDFRPLSLHPETGRPHSSRFKISGGSDGVKVEPK